MGSFWDGFKLGVLAGIVYNLIRNPGGCACCGIIVALVILVLAALIIGLILAIWEYLALLALIVIGVMVFRQMRAGR